MATHRSVFATVIAQSAPAVLRGPSRPDLLREESLADILAATAIRSPQQPALVQGERAISYGELNAVSNAIGRALASRGAAPGRVAGLFLPRGADLLIAQAGIVKSGAAWLPFDADAPLERIKTCLGDALAIGLVTCREWLPRLQDIGVPVFAVEDLLAEKSCVQPRAAKSSDPAYVIYTSGSTGRPKGIIISHRGICHFLRAENELLGVRADDRVYQGFSIAFDMSFEEIWISYLVGATLWIAPPFLVGDPELLAQSLARERITVLHAVPTLMGLLTAVPPAIRLLNLGGEVCPPALVRKLARPGLKLFNTYGPTEASVSASLAELTADAPVTIGMPLPNYGLLIVDEQGRPQPADTPGELCIFGPGLADGYLGRPDLTREKFAPNPVAHGSGEEKMYRTGDLGSIAAGGPVRCLGRTDNQVKVRGFRVELDEISAALSAQPGVAAAAVVLRTVADAEQLVAFVVSAPGEPRPAQLRRALSAQLPAYMVPAYFEFVAALPRLSSGKVDRKSLSAAPLREATVVEGKNDPATEDQAALFSALSKLFPGGVFMPESDFFDDLGGHSLLAARLVSILRGENHYAKLSVQDIYRERRLSAIALVLSRLRAQPGSARRTKHATIPAGRRFLCGLAQVIVLLVFTLLHTADWLGPFFVYQFFTGSPGQSVSRAVLYALAVFLLAHFAMFAVAIAGKRAAGRLRPGRYPLWGMTYFRWWLGEKFCELPDTYLLAGAAWMPLYLRALGARVGRDVLIDTLTFGAPELVTIADGVSLGTFVNLENARVENGELIIGPIHLKKDAVVDSYSVLEENTELGEGARLAGLSALSAGRKIPADEIWTGAPAQPSREMSESLPPRPRASFARRAALAALHAASALVVALLFFMPVFPAFLLIDWVDANTLDVFDSNINPALAFGFFLLLALPASVVFLAATMLLTGALRWLFPRQKAGLTSVHSLAYWRRRTANLVLDGSLRELHGLFASVFAPMWLRFLGVRVGRNAEVSTAEGMVPELLSIGDDSFVADGAMLGDEELRGGWMILRPTRIGNRSFIGNGAYVQDGTVVPDDVLIGVQTRSPKNEQLKSGQTWMGSPPLLLPARETLTGFPDSLTFRPSVLRRIARGIIEGLRIVLPLALLIATGYLIVLLVVPLAVGNAWGFRVAGALAIAGVLYGLASYLFVIGLKWILIGRYRPRTAPMWTLFVWLSEAVTSLYESLAVPNFLDLLRGTPMLPWMLRLLGARIGRGVYMNTTDLTEFDCVRIGDGAELNAWSGPQTHLFEDRVMKIGRVEIGARVTLGVRGTVLYDGHIGDGATLGPLTLVAKGERLPAQTRWEGSPAAPADFNSNDGSK